MRSLVDGLGNFFSDVGLVCEYFSFLPKAFADSVAFSAARMILGDNRLTQGIVQAHDYYSRGHSKNF